MVLEFVQTLLPVVFLTLAALWMVLSGFMLGERLVYDRTEGRVLRAAETLSEDADLRREMGRTPRAILERVASDSRVPERVARAVGSFLTERYGYAPYEIRAASTRKWKRIAALHILFHAGYAKTLGLLDAALADTDSDVVGAAVALLGRYPDTHAADLLVDAMRHQRYPASRIATALDFFPLPITRELMPLLSVQDAELRFWGVTLLARYRDKQGLVHVVSELANDEHERVRKAVAQTLGAFARAESAAVLLPLLDDESWIVRAHAARALGNLGRPVLADRVAPLLADARWWVRLAARESLVAMGPDVAPVLLGYLDHVDRFARNGAAEVLQNLGWLDDVLDAAIADGAGSDAGTLIEKALAAGGVEMATSFVRRQDEALQPRVAELLSSLGLESAADS